MQPYDHDHHEAVQFDKQVDAVLSDEDVRQAARTSAGGDALRAAAILASQPRPALPDDIRARIRSKLDLPAPVSRPRPSILRLSVPRWLGRVAAIFIAIIIAGGVLQPAVAQSLPGDLLYGVKRGVERVELALLFDDAARREWHLTQAQRRLDEAQRLPPPAASLHAPDLLAEAYDGLETALGAPGLDVAFQQQAATVLAEAQTIRQQVLSTMLPAQQASGLAQREQRLQTQLQSPMDVSPPFAVDVPDAPPSQPEIVYIDATQRVNLRAAPDENGAILQTLAPGVAVERINRQGAWIQVRLADGQVGWIHHTLLSASPVVDEPPSPGNGNGNQGGNQGDNPNDTAPPNADDCDLPGAACDAPGHNRTPPGQSRQEGRGGNSGR